MKYNILGKTGIKVSRAGFGVLALGKNHRVLSCDEGAELLLYARERGINFFDTAQYYEQYPLIGEFLKRAESRGFSREDMVICSKSLSSGREAMADAVDEALESLGLEYIDVFLMHEVRSGQLDERQGAWEALKDAKASGKVRAIGISTHHTDVAEAAAGLDGCDCVFALLNVRGMGIRTGEAGGPGMALPGYRIEDRPGTKEEMEEALGLCSEKGLGVFTMKALGGGNLAEGYREALDYVFSRPYVDSVMIGMSSEKETDDMISYLDGSLEYDYEADLSGKVLKVNHEDCMGCGECMKACASHAIYYGEDGLSEIDPGKCIGCGYCAYACPVRAVIRV